MRAKKQKESSVNNKELFSKLLNTKLTPAFIPGAFLHRSRLFAKLTANPKPKLTLICGPAGSGKSCLLYDYSKSRGGAIAWYSLSESDRGLKIFLSYLLTALAMSYPKLAAKTLSHLELAANLENEWKELVTLLINEIKAYEKEILLVLDDYHHVEESYIINEVMEFLLLNAPPNFRCLLASRTLTNLPVSYLQSKNALTLIRPEELFLDMMELEQLFHEVWRQELSKTALAFIYSKTEGWLAAIRLISQAIHGKSIREAEEYVKDLNLKKELIYDYLGREIFRREPEEIRTFLKYTAIPNYFNSELALFLTGVPSHGRILKQLEETGFLVVHLGRRSWKGGKEEWFRYHHLFSDFLRHILIEEEGVLQFRSLHKLAASWFEEHGEIITAIEHYFQAREFALIEQILKENGQLLFQQGHLTPLLKWINAFPQKLREVSPELLILEGEVHDILGSWEKAITCYEKAVSILKTTNSAGKVPFVLEKIVLCLIKYGEYSKIFDYCRQALETCNSKDEAIRSRILSWLGGAGVVYGNGKWLESYKLLEEGYFLAYKSQEPETIATACISYGFAYHFSQGNFLEAERVFSEGTELLRRLGLQFLACNQLMNKGVAQIFGGKLRDAEITIKEAFKIAEEYNVHFVKQALNVTQALLNLECNNKEGAKRSLSCIAANEIPLQLKPWYYRSLALFYATEGNLEQALVACQEMLKYLELIGKGMYLPECYIVMGSVFFKKHLYYKARQCFEKALAVAEQGKMKFWIMKAHYCLAALFAATGHRATHELKAHYHMAIRFSKENNYWHLWIIDPFNYTIPLLFEAFKLKLEVSDTCEIMQMVKLKLLETIKTILEEDVSSKRAFVCELLGVIKDHDAKLLLKKAQKDRIGFVKSKAQKAFSVSPFLSLVLYIRTLGSFAITRNGKIILNSEWRRQKALKIFKYFLAVYPKEVIVDQLIEIFWPDISLKNAGHNLAVHINYIRKALNPCGARGDETFIQRKSDIFYLNLKDCYFDVIEFQHLCKEGEKLWKIGKHEEAVQLFKDALELYKGDFLEGDQYEEWVLPRRGELGRSHLLLLERLGSFYEGRNNFQETFTYYQQYLEKQESL